MKSFALIATLLLSANTFASRVLECTYKGHVSWCTEERLDLKLDFTQQRFELKTTYKTDDSCTFENYEENNSVVQGRFVNTFSGFLYGENGEYAELSMTRPGQQYLTVKEDENSSEHKDYIVGCKYLTRKEI